MIRKSPFALIANLIRERDRERECDREGAKERGWNHIGFLWFPIQGENSGKKEKKRTACAQVEIEHKTEMSSGGTDPYCCDIFLLMR